MIDPGFEPAAHPASGGSADDAGASRKSGITPCSGARSQVLRSVWTTG